MKIGITGLPASGKSTVFSAITHILERGGEKLKPHLGAVKVPDPRIDELGKIFNSKKITHIEITFLDIPGFDVLHLSDLDAMVEVIGTFYSEDPIKDIEEVEANFMLRDLEIIQHRIPLIKKEVVAGKLEDKKELDTLTKCEMALSKDMPLRKLEFTLEEKKIIRTYQFLSMKPVLLISNIRETDIDKGSPKSLLNYVESKKLNMIEFCGKTELDILEIPEEERETFLKEMGIDILARDKFIKAAFDLLKLVSFFTVKGEEARAWAIPKDTPVIEAAGKIHTDMKRGFIRAEVINYKDLIACSGKFAEARTRGLLKVEGKDYIVKDGDILDIRFNV